MPLAHSQRGWQGAKVNLLRDYALKLIKKVPSEKIPLNKVRLVMQKPPDRQQADQTTLKIFEYLTLAAKGQHQRLDTLQREFEAAEFLRQHRIMEMSMVETHDQSNQKSTVKVQTVEIDCKRPQDAPASRPQTAKRPFTPKQSSRPTTPHSRCRSSCVEVAPTNLKHFLRRLVHYSPFMLHAKRKSTENKQPRCYQPRDFFSSVAQEEHAVRESFSIPKRNSQKRVYQLMKERSGLLNYSQVR